MCAVWAAGRRIPALCYVQTIEHLSDIFVGPLGDVMTVNMRRTELASTVYNMASLEKKTVYSKTELINLIKCDRG